MFTQLSFPFHHCCFSVCVGWGKRGACRGQPLLPPVLRKITFASIHLFLEDDKAIRNERTNETIIIGQLPSEKLCSPVISSNVGNYDEHFIIMNLKHLGKEGGVIAVTFLSYKGKPNGKAHAFIFSPIPPQMWSYETRQIDHNKLFLKSFGADLSKRTCCNSGNVLSLHQPVL